MQSTLPASNVDFTSLSHLIHFSVVPNSNGSLDSSVNSVTAANSADVVTRAHAAGKKVLISVGGANSQAGFQGATSAANRPIFITNLTNFMAARGYDGIDLDWEPLDAGDANQFTNLVIGLRAALNGFSSKRLLTAAVASQPALFASLQTQFDQINLMTYDLSGPWPGWVTWFNSPIYDGGFRFPSTGGLVPSIDGMVSTYTAAGIAPAKLGIGIAFYGYVWSGGAGTTTGGAALPRQTWTTAPTTTTPTYDTIMTTYYQSQLFHWDTNAQSAYLSMDNTGSANDKFISYDDEHACQAKVSYARNHGLGGVMIWELGSGYRPAQPAGQRDPLLQAVKQALATPRIVGIQASNHSMLVSFTSIPLGSYSVQWTTNLSAPTWVTLTTNLTGTSGTQQFIDAGATNSLHRFYRIKTPP
jgi:chitinase